MATDRVPAGWLAVTLDTVGCAQPSAALEIRPTTPATKT